MVESLARSWRTALFLGRRTACRTAPCAPTATFDSRGRAAWPRSLRTAARRV